MLSQLSGITNNANLHVLQTSDAYQIKVKVIRYFWWYSFGVDSWIITTVTFFARLREQAHKFIVDGPQTTVEAR